MRGCAGMRGLVTGTGWTVAAGNVKNALELKRFVLESPGCRVHWCELGFWGRQAWDTCPFNIQYFRGLGQVPEPVNW